jgi:UDP-N-acetylglucosamine--N-acetylmuramyl-(pentapeptide) pyrophosphoryl-undecaprenol N-acetylglucosamine transferase
VLIFGGSLGARSINYAAIEAFSDPGFRVLHISGRRDYPELSSKRLSARYDLREYMDHDEFAAALSAADLVIARAGGSVFEIAAHGLPAILVPYPRASADHQTVNARWMSEAGGAIVLEDRRLDAGRLAAAVSELLADESRLAAMAAASSTLARPHAARDVASELLAAVSR